MAADSVKGAVAGSVAPSAAAGADVALAALGHRTTGQWLGQESHRSVWEWISGVQSRNKP